MSEVRAARLQRSRTFGARSLAMAVLGMVAIIGVTAGVISMLWPSSEPFHAARVADLEPLVPQHFPNEGFWLVLLEDGDVCAFYYRDPRTGCPLRWFTRSYMDSTNPGWFTSDAPNGMFRDPCHGSSYGPDGTAFFGPTPRGLDRYAVEVDSGHAYVDLSKVLKGPRRARTNFGTPIPIIPPSSTPTRDIR